MPDSDQITQDAEAVASTMRSKLRVRGKSLSSVLSRGRRRLPRRVARAAGDLVQAEAIAQHPRLRLTLDDRGLTRARGEVERYLAEIDPADDRKGWFLGVLASLSVNLILFAVLIVSLLVWRGFL